ncbi:MAG: hypothetical protein K9J38_08655 [Polynucleobacter sp.]|nr:hypothetical protein [Polynucleobacter sp.]
MSSFRALTLQVGMMDPDEPFLLWEWSFSGSASGYVTVDTHEMTYPLKVRLSNVGICYLSAGL